MNRAKPSGYRLKKENVPVVKGMIKRGDRKHDIAAWFGVNPGRIADAMKGEFGQGDTEPALRLPPSGPPGIKGRALRDSLGTALDLYDGGQKDINQLLEQLRKALAKFDANEE